MEKLLNKFKPFQSQEEKKCLPELSFGGSEFSKNNSNFCTFIEAPNDSDNFVVVNRGKQQDCEMIEEAINDIVQKCLNQFLLDNADEILGVLHGMRQAERESKLKSLGYQELSEDKILDIRSGRSLI